MRMTMMKLSDSPTFLHSIIHLLGIKKFLQSARICFGTCQFISQDNYMISRT